MKRWLLVMLCLIGVRAAPAQSFTTIDRHAQMIQPDEQCDLTAFVRKLVAPARTDREKVRAVFSWIASHIQYDKDRQVPLWSRPTSRAIDTVAVVRTIMTTQRGICTDFALVCYQLCQWAGVPARIITGYAKASTSQAGTTIPDVNHQWNAVKLDGQWQLIDVTWASTNGGTRPLDFHYFLTPPNWFIADHFPNNPTDQLLDQPLSKSTFDAFPRVFPAYFALGLGADLPQRGLYQIKRRLNLRLNGTNDLEFEVLAHRYNQPEHERNFYNRTIRQKQGYELALQVLRGGVYSVYVFGRPRLSTGEFKPILAFTVISGVDQ